MEHKTNLAPDNFYRSVASILEQVRKRAATAVNLSMVYAYFEIGRSIVEEEQHSKNRAEYGSVMLKRPSAYLTDKLGKGFSETNLEQMRKFYKVYSCDEIPQTLSEESPNLPVTSTGRKFYLSWSKRTPHRQTWRITSSDKGAFSNESRPATRNDR